jgi:meso-butanediol dehydrogenase / (S,S)-butanediol dehydrogenase / diacetyl reductase
MRLSDRVVLITGGAGKVGRHIVRRFHDEGAMVAIVDLDAARIDGAYDWAGVPNERRIPIVGDVSTEDTNAEMVACCVDRCGRIDDMVLCAYWTTGGDATQISLDDWNRAVGVSLTPTYLAARHGVPVMTENGGGSITPISSIHGLLPGRGKFMYATTKAALHMLVRALSVDFAPRGIRFNCIASGGISETDERFDPEAATNVDASYIVGRYVHPKDIASTAVFLASDEARVITGQVVTVDGGTTLPLQDYLLHDIARRRGEE